MKAIGAGLLGAFLIIAAFLGGVHWSDLRNGSSPNDFARYEMHVSGDGTVIRLDRVTGTLHMVTANGASDVPENFVAPNATPTKP